MLVEPDKMFVHLRSTRDGIEVTCIEIPVENDDPIIVNPCATFITLYDVTRLSCLGSVEVVTSD